MQKLLSFTSNQLILNISNKHGITIITFPIYAGMVVE